MKKFLLSLMIFSLVFSFGGVSFAQEQTIEKIPSPDQIKNFEMIRKDGNSLFGIRKVSPAAQANIANNNSSLEKISRPEEISLFDKIVKKGKALWGVRKNIVPRPVYITPAAAQCVKTAIDKKDTTLKTIITSHSQELVTAIDARNVCQKAAIDKTTAKEQFEANKVCINVFQKGMKDISVATEKEKNEVQKIYRTDLKACSLLQTSGTSTSTKQTNEEIKVEDGDNE